MDMTEEEYEKKIKDLESQLYSTQQKMYRLAGVANGMASWGLGITKNEESGDEASRQACIRMFASLADEYQRMKASVSPKPKSLSELVYPKGHYHGD